jgi:prepilin-type N-terminal cleavage/methylation domain-containing protein
MSAPAFVRRRLWRRGVTLLELLIVLVILATGSAIVTVSSRAIRPVTATDSLRVLIAELRGAAVRTAHPLTRIVRSGDTLSSVTALPNGRVLAEGLRVNDLTGSVSNAPH